MNEIVVPNAEILVRPTHHPGSAGRPHRTNWALQQRARRVEGAPLQLARKSPDAETGAAVEATAATRPASAREAGENRGRGGLCMGSSATRFDAFRP